MRRTRLVSSLLAIAVVGTGVAFSGLGSAGAANAPTSASASKLNADRLKGGGKFILRSREGQMHRLLGDAQRSGAKVLKVLPIVDGLVVNVPATGVSALSRSTALLSAAPDAPVVPQGLYAGAIANQATAPADDLTALAGDKGSLRWITSKIGADKMWARGATGAGVDIAVVDTGVAPVQGLDGKIINGPDLSLDVPYTTTRGLDAYGHGTHMASIAAGLDPGTTNLGDTSKFVGVAPGSRIVNVKVGAVDGATDVSQVIAGIDWIVQHRRDPGMNIRVLNLSYGTDSTTPTADDPLSWAAEVAWRNGIVVVAAAGNDGAQSKVLSPARNPLLIAVGATDQESGVRMAAAFTSTSGPRQPDLWAPGAHVLGLRVPGSFVDTNYPTARVGTRLFRGSGTSQATAVVSGAAALLLSANPSATPDQIKAALIESGKDMKEASGEVIRIATADKFLAKVKAGDFPTPPVVGTPGRGSLEGARGGINLVFNGVPLRGEKDIFGSPWNGPASAAAAASLTSWNGGTFNGNSWSGDTWSGNSWAGNSWRDYSWAGNSWRDMSWTGNSWRDGSWTGNSWRADGWAGNSWRGNSWAGNSWRADTWAGSGWLSFGWKSHLWG